MPPERLWKYRKWNGGTEEGLLPPLEMAIKVHTIDTNCLLRESITRYVVGTCLLSFLKTFLRSSFPNTRYKAVAGMAINLEQQQQHGKA